MAGGSKKAWGLVGMMWVAYFLNYGDRQVVFSIFPILKRELHFTDTQLGLTGSLTVTDKAALDLCLDRYARVFAALVPWDRQTDIAVMPADGEFDDLGIGGFAAAAVDELVATASSSGEDAEDARAALALLLRLTEGGAA